MISVDSNPYQPPRPYPTRSVWDEEIDLTAWECLLLWFGTVSASAGIGGLLGILFA